MEAFTTEDDELLISLVSEHPLLYDLNDGEYKNSKKKDKTWNEISMELNKKGKYFSIFLFNNIDLAKLFDHILS